MCTKKGTFIYKSICLATCCCYSWMKTRHSHHQNGVLFSDYFDGIFVRSCFFSSRLFIAIENDVWKRIHWTRNITEVHGLWSNVMENVINIIRSTKLIFNSLLESGTVCIFVEIQQIVCVCVCLRAADKTVHNSIEAFWLFALA